MKLFYILIATLVSHSAFSMEKMTVSGRESNGAGGILFKSRNDLEKKLAPSNIRLRGSRYAPVIPLQKEIRDNETFVVSEAPVESLPVVGGYVVDGLLAASTELYPGAPTYINSAVLQRMNTYQVREMLIQLALYRILPDSERSVEAVEELCAVLNESVP